VGQATSTVAPRGSLRESRETSESISRYFSVQLTVIHMLVRIRNFINGDFVGLGSARVSRAGERAPRVRELVTID
jgi:hypothetical protein